MSTVPVVYWNVLDSNTHPTLMYRAYYNPATGAFHKPELVYDGTSGIPASDQYGGGSQNRITPCMGFQGSVDDLGFSVDIDRPSYCGCFYPKVSHLDDKLVRADMYDVTNQSFADFGFLNCGPVLYNGSKYVRQAAYGVTDPANVYGSVYKSTDWAAQEALGLDPTWVRQDTANESTILNYSDMIFDGRYFYQFRFAVVGSTPTITATGNILAFDCLTDTWQTLSTVVNLPGIWIFPCLRLRSDGKFVLVFQNPPPFNVGTPSVSYVVLLGGLAGTWGAPVTISTNITMASSVLIALLDESDTIHVSYTKVIAGNLRSLYTRVDSAFVLSAEFTFDDTNQHFVFGVLWDNHIVFLATDQFSPPAAVAHGNVVQISSTLVPLVQADWAVVPVCSQLDGSLFGELWSGNDVQICLGTYPYTQSTGRKANVMFTGL